MNSWSLVIAPLSFPIKFQYQACWLYGFDESKQMNPGPWHHVIKWLWQVHPQFLVWILGHCSSKISPLYWISRMVLIQFLGWMMKVMKHRDLGPQHHVVNWIQPQFCLDNTLSRSPIHIGFIEGPILSMMMIWVLNGMIGSKYNVLYFAQLPRSISFFGAIFLPLYLKLLS